MAKNSSRSLQSILDAAGKLAKPLASDDKATVAKAQEELKTLGAEFKAQAEAQSLKITTHKAEVQGDGPEPMRRCAPVISTVIGGKVNMCILVGHDGRKCLYSCSPASLSPA